MTSTAWGTRADDEQAALVGKWQIGNLWGETRIFRSQLLPGHCVPFARDGGGNRLFLDCSDDAARVHRLIIATKKTYRIARDFGTFIDMLQADPENSGQRAPRRRA